MNNFPETNERMKNHLKFSYRSYALGILTSVLIMTMYITFFDDKIIIGNEMSDGSIEIRNANIRLYGSSSDVIIYGSGLDPNKEIYSLAGFLKSRGDSSVSIIKMDSEGAGLETQVKLLIGIRKDP